MSAADCNRRWRKNHPDETNRISREGQRRARLEALTHYSGGTPRCACCGETHVEFLAIDHIGAEETAIARQSEWVRAKEEALPSGYVRMDTLKDIECSATTAIKLLGVMDTARIIQR